MTMIEIPLKSAEINGDRGTIALPLIDVLHALEDELQVAKRRSGKIEGLTPDEIDDMVRCCDEHSSCVDCPWDDKDIVCDQNVVVHYANLLIANLRNTARG